MLTVLIPAHDEEATIGAALDSVAAQTRPADHVVVIADNCTDRTAEIAAARGAEVVHTVGNTEKKAGALNQVLDRMLPVAAPSGAVCVMDADSCLDPGFLEHALRRLEAPPDASGRRVGGVGGVFRGRAGGGLVGVLQCNEYARYARDVGRAKGRALVLTGTAAVFPVDVLQQVVAARSIGELPGKPSVYDTHVLTEDAELTLAILHLGHRVVAPRACTLTTEVMETWGDLFRQRLRWKRGAIENLVDYGLTTVTWQYWLRQGVALAGFAVMLAFLVSLVWAVAVEHRFNSHPLWLAVTGLYSVERAVTVRRRGPWQMLVAAVLVVEMLFDLWLQAAYGKALWDTLIRKERRW